MNLIKSFFSVISFGFLVWQPLLGATPSAVKDNEISPFEKLEVEINGSRNLVDASASLEVVAGDLLVILKGWHNSAVLEPVEKIDIVGFAPKVTFKVGDSKAPKRTDQSYVVDTAVDLQKSFAINPDKTEYVIFGYSNGKKVARKVLRVVQPRLDRVDIALNGSLVTLRDGEPLKLKSTDKIAVRSVVTNIRGNENVVHELVAGRTSQGRPTKELIFARSGHTFGRIPIQWQE